MKTEIDAKGLECPQPVLLAKKALEDHNSITISVDNRTAVENLKRLGTKLRCTIVIDEKDDGTFALGLTKSEGSEEPVPAGEFQPSPEREGGSSKKLVMVISGSSMGKGNEELGDILIRSFLHTVTELDELPESLVFYNTGVKLAAEDSPVVDDLKLLEEKGVDILVCGTCVNFFQLEGKLGAGKISNMYDIAETMSRAGRLVAP